MLKNRICILITVAAIALRGISLAQAPSSDTGLTGMVRSSEGKSLEGVGVSARAYNKTYTTTVYTDEDGKYFFPPLEQGSYQAWAQAVGFERGSAEVKLMTGKKMSQDFTLKTLKGFNMQLSGTEWVESLPVDTPENRRMRAIVEHSCSSCHTLGFVLENRFDADGWRKIMDFMEKTGTGAPYIRPGAIPSAILHSYKEEIIGYLTQVRGPGPSPMKFKAFPRPKGEAAQIVVTEYDISPGHKPGYIVTFNGSDWSEGTPSKHEAMGVHDVVVDQEGYAWFTDNATPGRTIGKLDPRTGRVTDYKMADENGEAIGSHGIIIDQAGKVWVTAEGSLAQFDAKTKQFRRFAPPSSMPEVGGTVSVDSKGNPWVVNSEGAYKLDPKTGLYTAYKSPTKDGQPYGITVDSKDNAWYAEFDGDRLVEVDHRTGKVTEVVLARFDQFYGDKIIAKDIKIGQDSGMRGSGVPLYHKGPRRLGADTRGNAVWASGFWGGILIKVDIDTKKVTDYPLRYRGSNPYDAKVDKNHMVWINLFNSDRFAKFNPFTEQFTEYSLPTLGTGTRNIWVDNNSDVPIVWIPYNRTNRIARVQFRSATTSK